MSPAPPAIPLRSLGRARLLGVAVLVAATSFACSSSDSANTTSSSGAVPPLAPTLPPVAPTGQLPPPGATVSIGTPTTIDLPPELASQACGLFGRLIADIDFFQRPETVPAARLEAMVADLTDIFEDSQALFAEHPDVPTADLQADLDRLGQKLTEIDERLSANDYDWAAFAAANQEWLNETRTEVIDIIGSRLLALVSDYCPSLTVPNP